MLQQPAKPFTANDLASVFPLFRHLSDRHIPNSLVRPFGVIALHEFKDDVVEMLLAENDEMV